MARVAKAQSRRRTIDDPEPQDGLLKVGNRVDETGTRQIDSFGFDTVRLGKLHGCAQHVVAFLLDPTIPLAATKYVRDTLERQHAGEFRRRLVLREAVDLKPGGWRDPHRLFEYDFGPLPTTEVEVVIVTKDGRRHVVKREPPPWGQAGGLK